MRVRELLGGTWMNSGEIILGVGGFWALGPKPPTASELTRIHIRARRAVRCALRIARGNRMVQILMKISVLVLF